MGYIIDLNQKLLPAHNQNVRVERYLLDAIELNIDGRNWFNSIEIDKLQEVS